MAELVIRLTVPLPREVVWRRLWSPERHTAAIPLTVVRTSPPAEMMAVEGTRVLARTSVGPLGFDDDMAVEVVSTPAEGPWVCRVRKQGHTVRGSIEASVTAATPDRTAIRWRQRIAVAGMPAWLDPVTAAVAWVAYRTAIRRIVAA